MASLDMSLEDIIKNRRNTDKGARGRGKPRRGRGSGGPTRGGKPFGAIPRRNPLGVNARTPSVTIAKPVRRTKNLPWQNGLFEDSLKAAGLSELEVGTKLYVSNLDVGVSNEDIRELFLEFGEMIRYAIHFDKNGRPSGSAEVVFTRRSDAFEAFKRYNNVQLDGRPMKIEIVGSNAKTPISARINVGGANGKNRTVVMGTGSGRSRGGFTAFNRGYMQKARGGPVSGRGGGVSNSGHRGGGVPNNVRGGGGSRGRGGARRVKKSVVKSADDLDKELESYHAEAMQS